MPESAYNPQQTSRRYNLISASLAFMMWGGWAFFVNSQADTPGRASPLVSGLTQGIGSFCITLIMVRTVAWLYHRLPPNIFRLILPAALTVSMTGTCLVVVHSMVGTSNIVGTVAPALAVAFCFTMFTTFRIHNALPAVSAEPEGPLV